MAHTHEIGKCCKMHDCSFVTNYMNIEPCKMHDCSFVTNYMNIEPYHCLYAHDSNFNHLNAVKDFRIVYSVFYFLTFN